MNLYKQNQPVIKAIIRPIIFSIILIITILIFIDVISAFLFINKLIYPECLESANPYKNYNPEEYLLKTDDGIMIQIWYYPSRNGSAIIELGGLTGSLGAIIFPIEDLLDNGFGVVQVGSRACDRGDIPVTLGGKEVNDGKAALQFLLGRSEISEGHIGVMGFSSGGATAIRLAVENPEINAVVRDGGFVSLEELFTPIKKGNFVIHIFRKTLLIIFQMITGVTTEDLNILKEIGNLSPTSILLIYGEDEIQSGIGLFKAAHEPKELWIVPGGSHGSNYKTAKVEYVSRLLNFFERNLME